MAETTAQAVRKRDYEVFKKTMNDMVAEVTTERRRNSNPAKSSYVTTYSRDEVEDAIERGNIETLRDISRFFYYKSGFYRRTLLYFATMLIYNTLLTPILNENKTANQKKVMKKYHAALTYIKSLNLNKVMPHIMTKMFVDGAYFGLVTEFSEREVVFRDLPTDYCRTTYQTGNGMNVLEFDVSFFDKLTDKVQLEELLKSFPPVIQKGYRKYKSSGEDFKWMIVPPDLGVAFTIGDQRPPMVSIIPAIIMLDDYRDMEYDKDAQSLERMVVQEIPFDKDGEMLLEMDEIKDLHSATMKMLSATKHLSVLTTFGKVTVPSLKDTRQLVQDNLEKVEKSIYGEAGVSKEIFSPTRNLSLSTSILNDLSYVMSIVEQIGLWIQTMTRNKFDDNTVSFDVQFLAVSYYNQKEMSELYLKQAQSGYSKILPALAVGVKQHQITALTHFENEMLDIVPNMIPLQTSYTQPGGDQGENNGRPKKTARVRQQKTDDNLESGT